MLAGPGEIFKGYTGSMAKARESIVNEITPDDSENRRSNGNGKTYVNGNGSYSEQDIQILEGLEAVRVRPGMYIGATDQRGLHHLIYEVVDNSIDEVMAGIADTITVVIHADGSVIIEDNGRGIPVEEHQQRPARCGRLSRQWPLRVVPGRCQARRSPVSPALRKRHRGNATARPGTGRRHRHHNLFHTRPGGHGDA